MTFPGVAAPCLPGSVVVVATALQVPVRGLDVDAVNRYLASEPARRHASRTFVHFNRVRRDVSSPIGRFDSRHLHRCVAPQGGRACATTAIRFGRVAVLVPMPASGSVDGWTGRGRQRWCRAVRPRRPARADERNARFAASHQAMNCSHLHASRSRAGWSAFLLGRVIWRPCISWMPYRSIGPSTSARTSWFTATRYSGLTPSMFWS